MRTIRKTTGIVLSIVLMLSVFSGIPFYVSAAGGVTYVFRSWDPTEKKVVQETRTCTDYTELSAVSGSELNQGSYVVSHNTTVDSRLVVSGTADLILCDGAKLTLKKGIRVPPDARLNIFGQSKDTGKIYAHMPRNSEYAKGAVIGGGNNENSGDIYIHGGTLDLNNGDGYSSDYNNGYGGACIGGGIDSGAGEVVIYGGDISVTSIYSAGIGGGRNGQASWKSGESIRIYGGRIDAYTYEGAAIGNGESCSGSAGGIAIYGGEITAKGISGAAGIGGSGHYGDSGKGGSNGPVTIYGGIVTASGTGSKLSGAGIGSGGNADQGDPIRILGGIVVCLSQRGAGIGAGAKGKAGIIEIDGANVTAASFSWGAGIGGGYGGDNGEITIKNSTVNATSCNYGSAQDFLNAFEKMGCFQKMQTNQQAYVNTAVNGMLLLVELFQKDYSGAAIGGGRHGHGGTITIKDSEVEAECGNCAAAIGGGQGKSFDTITIDNSTILKAKSKLSGAGIGSGQKASDGGGTINIINGSDVKASCGNDGAGIGTGDNCGSPCTAINISDSTVEAHGGDDAAGIGGGSFVDGGTITISNSTVTADTKSSEGAGIGGGIYADSGTITIKDNSDVTATGGMFAAGIGGGSYGDGQHISITDSAVKAYGGTDATGIGGGRNGDGGTIEIFSSSVYAKGKGYAAGIGCGEYGEKADISIYSGSTVEAVAGGESNTVAIGHGDYRLSTGYDIDTFLDGGLYVEAGKDKNHTDVYKGDERYYGVWNNKYARLSPCSHQDTEWRYDNSAFHVQHCLVCGGRLGTTAEEHVWDSDNQCTVCGGSAAINTLTLVERNNSGEVRTTYSGPRHSYYTLPQCTNVPDGMEFVCWMNEDPETFVPGNDIPVYNDTITALYLPVVETGYIDETGKEQTIKARVLTMDLPLRTVFLTEGWYVVQNDILVDRIIELKGNVNLILSDGKKLEYIDAVNGTALRVKSGGIAASLNLYGQSDQSGVLNLNKASANISDIRQYGGVIKNGTQVVVTRSADIAGGTFDIATMRATQGADLHGGNIRIKNLRITRPFVLGWTKLTDSIQFDSVSVVNDQSYNGSVTIADGQSLRDEENNIYTGLLTDAQISAVNGKTLTPYTHEYDDPEWVWSNKYQDATAVFRCRECDDVQEIEARVDVDDSGRNRTATARCHFNGQDFSTTQTFPVIFEIHTAEYEHGTVAADRTEAGADEIVTLDIVPDEGFGLLSLTVTDADDNEVELHDGSYFIMPESYVTVTASFAQYYEKVEPSIDEDGAYIPGTVRHYEAGGKNYSVNEDGTAGEELSSISLSYFDFDLQDDSCQINYYTGPTGNLTVLEIPKTFDGRPVTTLGSDDSRPIIADPDKQQSQFELLLNENITQISPYAFSALWVTDVTGDTSGLSTIGDSAFSSANSPGGGTLDIRLDHKGEISVGSDIFNNMNVSLQIAHATTFSSTSFGADSLDYTFTDPHPYSTPEWNWSEDNTAASAAFTCPDSRCQHSETVDATVTREIRNGKGYYVAGVELDGETYEDTKEIDYFVGHSLSLNGDIGVNFYLDLSEQEIADGAAVDFVWTVDGTEKTHSAALTSADNTTYGYRASCPVAVAEMTYDVTATLTIGGTAVGSDTYSAVAYANVILTDNSFRTKYIEENSAAKYEQLVRLVQTMLDYGSKAQVRFDRDPENPANGGTEYFTGEETIPGAAGDMEEYLDDCGLEYAGTSVIYLSQTTLRHYYKIVDPSRFTDDISNGITFDGESAAYGEKDDMIFFDKKDIAASQLDTEYVLTINGHDYHYSALDYSALAYSSDDEPYDESITKQLAAAVYRYNQAANEYFED